MSCCVALASAENYMIVLKLSTIVEHLHPRDPASLRQVYFTETGTAYSNSTPHLYDFHFVETTTANSNPYSSTIRFSSCRNCGNAVNHLISHLYNFILWKLQHPVSDRTSSLRISSPSDLNGMQPLTSVEQVNRISRISSSLICLLLGFGAASALFPRLYLTRFLTCSAASALHILLYVVILTKI